jgi:hypothetical protein
VQELDELDDELLDELVLEVIELLEPEVLRPEDEAEVMFQASNFVDELVAVLIDIEVDDDGDEVIEVYEIVVQMMINEVVDEVDM